MSKSKRAIEISGALSGLNWEWQDARIFKRVKGLRVQIASQLAFASNGQDIEYMSASVGENDSLLAVLVTQDRVVKFEKPTNGESRTTVFKRRLIESIVLHEVPDIVSDEWSDVKRILVQLNICGEQIFLPCSKNVTQKNVDDLLEYVPKLLAGLDN